MVERDNSLIEKDLTVRNKGVMLPNLDFSHTPPFYQLSSKQFEALCCELINNKKGIVSCDLHGVSGQTDLGVDLKAYTITGEAILGECKSNENIDENIIKKAATRVLDDHIQHWNQENVTKFILFLATDIQRTQVHDEIRNQKSNFEGEGIEFEVWSAQKLRKELMDYPDIVSRYCQPADYWVNVICEENPNTQANLKQQDRGLQIVNKFLTKKLSEATSDQIKSIRESIRRGFSRKALHQIREIKEDRGAGLNDNVFTEILKLESILVSSIDENNEEAERLLEEAKAIKSDVDIRYERTFILYQRQGPEAILEELEEPSTLGLFNLRIACLLENRIVDEFWKEVEEAKDSFEYDTETLRLQAIACLFQQNIERAVELIDQAIEEQPEHFETNRIKGIINYYSTISPAVFPEFSITPPMPVFRHYLIKSPVANKRLSEAHKIFERLIEIVRQNQGNPYDFQIWKIACLANLDELDRAGKTEKANGYARDLLSENPLHYGALIWGTARDFTCVNELSTAELIRAYEREGSPGVNEVIGVLVVLLSRQEIDIAERIHRESGGIFEDSSKELWEFWKARVLLIQGKYEEALQVGRDLEDTSYYEQIRDMVYHLRNYQKEESEELEEYLAAKYDETGRGDYLYELCEVKGRHGDWDFVFENADELVEKIGTDSARRMALAGAFNSGRPRRTLEMLGEYYGH